MIGIRKKGGGKRRALLHFEVSQTKNFPRGRGKPKKDQKRNAEAKSRKALNCENRTDAGKETERKGKVTKTDAKTSNGRKEDWMGKGGNWVVKGSCGPQHRRQRDPRGGRPPKGKFGGGTANRNRGRGFRSGRRDNLPRREEEGKKDLVKRKETNGDQGSSVQTRARS